MKRLYIFTGSNCSNCDALKPKLKELDKSKYELHYFDMDDYDPDNGDSYNPAFSKYRVRGIPVVFEAIDGIEQDGTRQIGNIDLSKY